MNNTWKRFTLIALGAGLAVTVGISAIGTTFAQSSSSNQAQTQQDGSGFMQRGGPRGMHRDGGRGGFAPAVVAKALGITEDELRTAQQDGKSVADLANEKGVTLDTIINAILADETTRLNQAVTDGKITQEQADQRLADLKTNLPDRLSQTSPANLGPGGFGRGGHFGGPGSSAVIAQALGITEDELRTAFQDGKSVADVASEKGVALDTVINAIVADATTHLNQEVTDGKITQEQADQRLADLKDRLPDMLSQVPPARPEGEGIDGHRGHGGFDDQAAPDSNPQIPDSNSGSSSSSSVAPALQAQDTSL